MSCKETKLESIIGYIALSFELIHRLPQLIKLYKTKRSEDISETMIFIQFIALSLYIFYAILRTDNIILVGSVIAFCQNILMIFMIKNYKKNENTNYNLMMT
jgi:MtN3 and saliva related transmembrane protein